MSDKIELNLNEENELCFEIVIEGSTTNESLDKPIMRFQIEESLTKGKGISYTFPVTKVKDGSLSVLIPRLENIVSEGKDYVGNLEVIIGGQFFVPQTVDINFIKPLKIESKGVTVNKQPLQEETSPTTVSARVSNLRKPTPKKKKKLEDYSEEEQTLLRKEFARRKAALLKQKKTKENKRNEPILELDDSWFKD